MWVRIIILDVAIVLRFDFHISNGGSRFDMSCFAAGTGSIFNL